ncbi:uncharacterized protein [Coffea arabica]|uniref:Uncharacterized protein isoform X1 n=1 Tax=Coffea arabica TaxID=13443 RepID=A0ABM4WED7_COFAR
MDDRSWIFIEDRVNNPYFEKCLSDFLKFAYKKKEVGSRIYCPCRRCKNSERRKEETVRAHVTMKGFLTTYTNWIYHGEDPWDFNQENMNNGVFRRIENDDMNELIHETLGRTLEENSNINLEELRGACDEETNKFFKLLKHAETELYPGCKNFTLLSFVIKLLHVKSLCRWSNNSMTILLELLKEVFPENELFPSSYRDAWKIVKDLGLSYHKIHACPNDCLIYWKETEHETFCRKCGTPRYKQIVKQFDDSSEQANKVPAKLVRYFPLKPRLQRLFMSSKTASLMRWHEEERIKDGKLRHPADSLAWKHFNDRHPSFASDPRNVRVGLAADGFNPFKAMNNKYSTWPVILVPYNLPSWMCMKQTSFMLCLLIDGPKAPGNDIHVYLQPVIDELNEFWDPGVPTYDAASKQMFYLRAALLWTINDFPAYGNLSGWSTKGKYACPCCNKDVRSQWLMHSKKHCYLGHRRFLAIDHPYRLNRAQFDGTIEKHSRPVRLYGFEILEQLRDFRNEFGKDQPVSSARKRKRRTKDNNDFEQSPICRYNWKRLNVFFQLPYWVDNLLPHNLDIMHIEKNFLENLLWTLLGMGKTNDDINARYDLKEMGIRKALHPQSKGDKVFLPPACFTMSKDEKEIFCNVLKTVKVPDGYASNISRCVNIKERQISGLKSHDCHILMQQLLSIAVRRILPK